jgi:hypothetical protein
VDWVLNLEVVGNHGPHALVVLREDGLKDREIILSHLVSDLIEDINELGLSGILAHIEHWWLQALGHHIIPIQDFLWQDNQDRVDLFIVQEPSVLQFKDFAHEQVFVPLVRLLWVLE